MNFIKMILSIINKMMRRRQTKIDIDILVSDNGLNNSQCIHTNPDDSAIYYRRLSTQIHSTNQ